MSDRPVVLVVAPGDENYRGCCLERVADTYDVVLLTATEPSWEKPHITDHALVDVSDPAAVLAGGRALAARHDLAGVMTWDEWCLVPTARLARALGLPANSVEVTRACRNKATARTLFARHGVPSAVSRSVRSLPEAQAAAAQIGYPVVLKPAAHAGAMGVQRVDTPAQLTAAHHVAQLTAEPAAENNQVLVEEFLDGPEISVECVTYRGATTVVAVNRKTISPPPHFEQLAHRVDAADPLLGLVAPAARAAVEALGITNGISHIEMRLVDGRPRLIEVNGRLAGDMIGHLVRLATGIDLPRAAADLACGRAPDLTATRSGAAAIGLIYPHTSGTLTRLDYTGPRPPWLDRLCFQRRPGDQLVLPQDGGTLYTARAGFYVVTGSTTVEVTERLNITADKITVTTLADR
ncbi:acetyl-CoA carboxylase biotin carboxylase subunit family protein [Streptomyces sp. NPDC056405]|uniref:ATP-grasp domain-containing protein n=1 Tax=Streptomyces sp. NPDC056405 TaxID=3345811 RepID=UPI0035DB87F9